MKFLRICFLVLFGGEIFSRVRVQDDCVSVLLSLLAVAATAAAVGGGGEEGGRR